MSYLCVLNGVKIPLKYWMEHPEVIGKIPMNKKSNPILSEYLGFDSVSCEYVGFKNFLPTEEDGVLGIYLYNKYLESKKNGEEYEEFYVRFIKDFQERYLKACRVKEDSGGVSGFIDFYYAEYGGSCNINVGFMLAMGDIGFSFITYEELKEQGEFVLNFLKKIGVPKDIIGEPALITGVSIED